MATFKPVTPLVGVNLDRLDTTQEFSLGTEVGDTGGRTWQYVQSNTVIQKNFTVHINTSGVIAAITPALAITAGRIGVTNATAFTTSTYGWVVTNGPVTLATLGSCSSGVPLYTTDSAGVLDDATVSLSQHQIIGVVLADVQTLSTTGTESAVLQFPSIRRPAT